jgi:peroxiredoxin
MKTHLLLGMLAGIFTATTMTATQDEDVQGARKILESSAKAYRDLAALRDKISYTATEPGATEARKEEYSYAFGPKGAAMIKAGRLQAFAVGSTLYVIRDDAPDKYVAVPYDGDLGAALRRVGSLFELPPLVLHSGKDIDACIDALRFSLLDPLRIVGYQHVTGERELDEIRLVAKNGELTLGIDSKTHLFATLSFQAKPKGAPEGFLVRVNGTFSPELPSTSEAAIDFTPGTRSAVEHLADLTTSGLRVGSVAPDFELETLDGKKIALHDLRGSIVVLDFWATWCVPCWTALKETQKLSTWAAGEKLKVAIVPINTSEHGSDNKEKMDRIRHFWKAQNFSIPTVVDTESKIVKAYGSQGLPTVVLISDSGTILRYHVGDSPNLLETLKRELLENLNSQKKSP